MQNKKSKTVIRNSKKGIIRIIFGRFGMISLFLVLQLFAIFAMFYSFQSNFVGYFSFNAVFSVAMSLFLINSDIDPTAKITWLGVIALFPLFGSLLFAYTQSDIGHRALRKRTEIVKENTIDAIKSDEKAIEELKRSEYRAYAMTSYVAKCGCHPLFFNKHAEYFESGEAMLKKLLASLKAAEHYIFLEFFIIEQGKMWQDILDILIEKAQAGVEVRVMYDGTCEFSTLPHNFPSILASHKIKCKIFAPITPFLSTHYNYRDHRKIAVIDGKTAFTGGVNLADEYINLINPYGVWKDTAVMVEGDAACSFALMFLQMWSVDDKKFEYDNYIQTHPQKNLEYDGLVMPYSDCPLDKDKVGERVYVDMINRAKEYIHIMTPYLILDCVTENAIKYAAERGVQVSIILPGIPDKKIPYALAKSHYKSLMASGVKIFEFEPGFVHAKNIVCDGKEAVVGTINFDYRSLYHHFECGLYMYECSCIGQMNDDFAKTISNCSAVTEESVKKEKVGYKILGIIFKIFAPLL